MFIVSLPGVSQRLLEKSFCCREDVRLVGIAEGGLSALKAAKDLHPEVVVIDSNLPVEETAALVREIRAIDARPSTVVLVENSSQFARAWQAGPDIVMRGYELELRLDALLQELRAGSHGTQAGSPR